MEMDVRKLNELMKQQTDKDEAIKVIGNILSEVAPKLGYLQFNFKAGKFMNHNVHKTVF